MLVTYRGFLYSGRKREGPSAFIFELTQDNFLISLKTLEIGYRLNDFQNPDIIENVTIENDIIENVIVLISDIPFCSS